MRYIQLRQDYNLYCSDPSFLNVWMIPNTGDIYVGSFVSSLAIWEILAVPEMVDLMVVKSLFLKNFKIVTTLRQ